MLNSKLISLLDTFETKQFTRFEAFVNSPYFNKSQEVTKLVGYLRKHRNRWSSKTLSEPTVIKKISDSKKPLDNKSFSYIMSDTHKLALSFLSVELNKQNHVSWSAPTLEYLVHQKLDKSYKGLLKETDLEHMQLNHDARTSMYATYQMREIECWHDDARLKRVGTSSLQEASNALDAFFVYQKLVFSCEFLNRSKIVGAEYEMSLLSEVLRFVETKNHELSIPIQMYFAIYRLLTNTEPETSFNQLEALIKSHHQDIHISDAKRVLQYAQNFCVRQINQGNRSYEQSLFELYAIGVESRVLFDERGLSPWIFNNVVSVAVKLERFEWTEHFIQEQSAFVHEAFRPSAVAFNEAAVAFATKDFHKAQEALLSIEFNDVFYQVNSKSLLIRIYFELQEEIPLQALIDAFNIYIRRSKLISDVRKQGYLSFSKYVRRCAQLKYRDKDYAQRIKDQFENEGNLMFKDWINEKIEAHL